jgi:cyclic beta-1,2-glucan synthetase
MATLAWTSGVKQLDALAVLLLVGGLPFSELAIQIVNALIFRFFPPDELPRLALESGIPAESATLVVIPMMLGSAAVIRREAEKLEVRYLGNPEPHLYFALLADFADAGAQTRPEDAVMLGKALDAIRDLNTRHGGGRFFLFHRQREWSETEQAWLGRERKRARSKNSTPGCSANPTASRQAKPCRNPFATSSRSTPTHSFHPARPGSW